MRAQGRGGGRHSCRHRAEAQAGGSGGQGEEDFFLLGVGSSPHNLVSACVTVEGPCGALAAWQTVRENRDREKHNEMLRGVCKVAVT